MAPNWLHALSIFFLAAGFLCSAIIRADLIRHPQRMAIMNVVWPVTALFGTVIKIRGYLRYGRLATREAVMAAKGASRCGSG